MKSSLKEFKTEFQNVLLNFLWRQWSALGVAGQPGREDTWAIDPEALLLFTCTMGRRDPRLFDEVLDWLEVNGTFINIMRLKRILRTEAFAGGRALAAIAGCLSKGSDAAKWRLLAKPVVGPHEMQPFFVAADGEALPVIGEPEPHFAKNGLKRGPLRLRVAFAEVPPNSSDEHRAPTPRLARDQRALRNLALSADPRSGAPFGDRP